MVKNSASMKNKHWDICSWLNLMALLSWSPPLADAENYPWD